MIALTCGPRVACDTLIRDDGMLFTVLASHAPEPLTVKPALDAGELVTLAGQEAGEGVTLDPFGIKVLRITGPALGGSGALGAGQWSAG